MTKTPEKNTISAQTVRLNALAGWLTVALLALAAWALTRAVYAVTLPLGIPGKALEYPLWGAVLGVAGNLVLRLLGLRQKIQAGIRTELFLKIGLVLLGAGINLSLLVSTAGGAVIQALIMITCVFFFSFWVAGKFGLDDRLRAVMATALSVCGVSAAIAAAGAVAARKEQVTYVTTLVILVALPMMVLTPLVAQALHLSQPVAGAWFGGNIDTTAAVIGAGTLYGEQAQKTASVVKATQNALIGVVAFLLAVYAARKNSGEKPGPHLIWARFPKFVIGFVLASVLFSLGWIDGGKGTALDALKNWAFLLAFVCMGLDLSFKDLKTMGWRPVAVFLLATVFNTLLALGVSSLLFGGA